jgi:hypothetical protein
VIHSWKTPEIVDWSTVDTTTKFLVSMLLNLKHAVAENSFMPPEQHRSKSLHWLKTNNRWYVKGTSDSDVNPMLAQAWRTQPYTLMYWNNTEKEGGTWWLLEPFLPPVHVHQTDLLRENAEYIKPCEP